MQMPPFVRMNIGAGNNKSLELRINLHLFRAGLMKQKNILVVHISLETEIKPDMERSPTNLLITLRGIINTAVQRRFPEYEVEIGRLEGHWPDSEKEFPPTEL